MTINRSLPPRYVHNSGPLWKMRTPWLTYAIAATHTGLVKIGKCHRGTEYNRFKSAEKLIGERCDWLGYLDVPEREAHDALRDFWVFREWFEPSDAVSFYLLDHLCQDPPRRRR